MNQSQFVVIFVPSPFPYKSSKTVPWNHDATAFVHELEERAEDEPTKVMDVVTHISEGSGMTRSGRIFAPNQLIRESNEAAVEAQKRKEAPSQDKGLEFSDQSTSKDDDEFLKIIKRSEYKIVDQLNQTPSKISKLSLLLNSEAHRKALMKVLNQVHVSQDVTTDRFDGIVANITAISCLSFNDEDLPVEGKAHNKALHISTMCHDTVLARVLVDNGSSLNVLPKSTLNLLMEFI